MVSPITRLLVRCVTFGPLAFSDLLSFCDHGTPVVYRLPLDRRDLCSTVVCRHLECSRILQLQRLRDRIFRGELHLDHAGVLDLGDCDSLP